MILNNVIKSINYWCEKNYNKLVYDDGKKKFYYKDLKNWSNKLLYYLIKKKINGKIIVFGHLEFEMIVSFFAISKMGLIYIPLDISLPNDKIKTIIKIVNPVVIISIVNFPFKLEENILLISYNKLIEIFNKKIILNFDLLKKKNNLNNIYYIIFTSGTTGIPKGVQITHNNLLNFINWMLEKFSIKNNKKFLSQALYSFDLSIMSIYCSLTTGGVLCVVNKNVINDFNLLFNILYKFEIEYWVSTPSFLEFCMINEKFNKLYIKKLDKILLCGEELYKNTAKKILKLFNNIKLYNLYGPTECTVAVTGVEINEKCLKFDRLPIGFFNKEEKKFNNIYIFNNNKILNSGEGEIIISGNSVSIGYLNDKKKTKEFFFKFKNKLTYFSGDIGKIKKNYLFYKCRKDFQIKFYGYRIELEEISNFIRNIDIVKQALVIPKYYNNKIKQLIAYVILEKNKIKEFNNIKISNYIKKCLKEKIVSYMIPKKILYINYFPLTLNKKIDFKKLFRKINP